MPEDSAPILDRKQLVEFVAEHRTAGERIVLANGCADHKRRLAERHGAADANSDGAAIVVEQHRR